MKIIVKDKKAKWVTDDKSGKFQTIKEENGEKYITMNSEKVFLKDHFKPIKNVLKPRDDNEEKYFQAYHNSKYFWDKMFSDVGKNDYYYYRGKCLNMPLNFFNSFS